MIFDDPRLPLPIRLTRLRQSKRLRLRLDQSAQQLRLTMPWRGSARRALDWAVSQRPWIDQQLERAPAGQPFADGAVIPLEGRDITLRHCPEDRRGVALVGDELRVGGPVESLAPAVERWLRRRARDVLSTETAAIAATAGVRIGAVSVGDAVSRWGSCSSSGSLRYSWRLILAPPQVLRFVVAHEVAHRLHMDHSPAFKAAEERLFGGPVASAREELRRLGPSLRAVGRA